MSYASIPRSARITTYIVVLLLVAVSACSSESATKHEVTELTATPQVGAINVVVPKVKLPAHAEILVAPDGAAQSTVVSLGKGETHATIPNLTSDSSYRLRWRTNTDTKTPGDWSTAFAVSRPLPPPPPRHLAAQPGVHECTLNWRPSSTPNATYELLWAPAGADSSQVVSTLTETKYVAKDLDPLRSWRFRVRVQSIQGRSKWSPVTSCVPKDFPTPPPTEPPATTSSTSRPRS